MNNQAIFVKAENEAGDSIYFNIKNIVAVNAERGVVYCNGGDVFIVISESAKYLMAVINQKGYVYEEANNE